MLNELKKIDLRKKEREKKAQDLQKLISQADNNVDTRKTERKATKKKVPQQMKIKEAAVSLKCLYSLSSSEFCPFVIHVFY